MSDTTIYTFRTDNPSFSPAYTCNLPGNNQGDYVQVKDYLALESQLKEMAKWLLFYHDLNKANVEINNPMLYSLGEILVRNELETETALQQAKTIVESK